MLPQDFNYFTDTPVDFSTGYEAPTFDFEGLMFNTLPGNMGAGSGTKSDADTLLDIAKFLGSPERQKELLKVKLDFDKQQMAQAAPYKLAFDIPRQLGDAFFKPALMELAGAGKYAQIMDAGIARMPNMVPGAIGIGSIPQRNYFG